MRNLISHLTTYHLVHHITMLRNVVDKSLRITDEEKNKRFKLLNEALKLKLDGLMQLTKTEDKSLQSMIEDLGFIENKKVQFVIADTFSGFQVIVDIFNSSANDYFVQYREALLRESRSLYNDICTMCMKGLVYRSKESLEIPVAPEEEGPSSKKSWVGRLFSS